MALSAALFCLFFVGLFLNHGTVWGDDLGTTKPANILFIMLDDLGRADIGALGAEWDTPNIDNFMSESLFLSHHYIGFVCSASRSQFLTGRYSFHNGYGKMDVFDRAKIGGIPLGTPTIANYLKTYANYKTYAIGKWQLGYSFPEQTPNYRGFDYFYGFYGGLEEYFDKTATVRPDGTDPKTIKDESDTYYLDFWENNDACYDSSDTYSTYQYSEKIMELIDNHNINNENNDPFFLYAAFQAPHMPFPNEYTEFKEKCQNEYSQYYVGMTDRDGVCEAMLGLDYAIGEILDYLKSDKLKDIWDNTLVIFTSDNGGALSEGSCNYPLRGGKNTFFEGNQRVVALVGGGLLPDEQRGKELDGLISNVDWLPTLLSFGGIIPTNYIQATIDNSDDTINKNIPLTLDGYNFYNYFMNSDSDPIRDHVILHISPQTDDDDTVDADNEDDTLLSSSEILTSLNVHELAMIFYDDMGNLWKYFESEESTNEIGSPQINCNWCILHDPNQNPMQDMDVKIEDYQKFIDDSNHRELKSLESKLDRDRDIIPIPGEEDIMDPWKEEREPVMPDNSQNKYDYIDLSGSVTSGIFDLTNDISEEINLLDTMSDELKSIILEKASLYFNNQISESSIYLYGNFDCFYDKHNIQAWPGNLGGIWAPFLDREEFLSALLRDCELDTDHKMFQLHSTPFELPDINDVIVFQDANEIAKQAHLRMFSSQIHNNVYESYNSNGLIFGNGTIIGIIIVAFILIGGMVMYFKRKCNVNAQIDGYHKIEG